MSILEISIGIDLGFSHDSSICCREVGGKPLRLRQATIYSALVFGERMGSANLGQNEGGVGLVLIGLCWEAHNEKLPTYSSQPIRSSGAGHASFRWKTGWPP